MATARASMIRSSAEIRSAFLEFFRERGHEVVPSSPLVPANDPTLLFTNAGMVPFKEVFLGREECPYRRAVTTQRCVRAGGKHNDLENVGYTARHHTFFEMLGNFSFGDYFKRDGIRYAWSFLTEALALPPEKLWVTVFEEDDEAAAIWLEEIGVDPQRFSRIGAHDNFWAMGDTGPCGPCSEVFYDHGPEVAGGPPGTPEEDGDRYIEIWNLVFMQYDRDADGTMTPLPRPSIDTGMGLERIAAVIQGVHNNFEIDLFRRLVGAAAALARKDDLSDSSLRVIADHIRACAFLVVDGVFPSNEGRGYVLRRIIRRAVRHGYKLGIREPFFYRLVQPLVDEMGDAFPELRQGQRQAERILRQEEERFRETLVQGLKLLEADLERLSGREVPGDTVFKLYDTFGFPVDLTADIARERGLELDMDAFERAMAEQRERARAASRFRSDHDEASSYSGRSEFIGYEHLTGAGRIEAVFRDGEAVGSLEAGDRGVVILERTPFYAESGGQVGDRGWLRGPGIEFVVEDTVKYGSAHGHIGKLNMGRIEAGGSLQAEVDAAQRAATQRNHTATHLLHAALREALGEHVAQKGSLVAPRRLRFDFSHLEPPTAAQLQAIERRVNDEIRANTAADVQHMAYDDAIALGAMALFGEKYGERVRVMRFGGFSTELCGGTHVARTGDIGLFKIVSETGISAGVRRIEAMTGDAAVRWCADTEARLLEISEQLRVAPEEALGRLRQTLERSRAQEKEIERLKQILASQAGTDLAASAVAVGAVQVVASQVEGDGKALRDTLDQLKNKLGSAVIVLAAADGGKVRLVAGVTPDLHDRLPAGKLVNAVAAHVGGRGGGRADFAQAGGSEPENLPAALKTVPEWVRARLE